MEAQPRNPYICLTIVVTLGLFGLMSVGGIVACALLSKDIPSALIAIASGCGGNLASFLVSVPRGSAGYGTDAKPAGPSVK